MWIVSWDPVLKKNLLKSILVGPMNSAQTHKKNKNAHIWPFHRNPNPTLVLLVVDEDFFFLLSEKWKIVDKRLISVSFKFFVKWCDYFLTKYSWQFFYFLRRKYSWYLIQYIRFLKLGCLMCGYNLFLVLLTNGSSCKTVRTRPKWTTINRNGT